VLYSPGRENMLWSFQLAWVMTINFGMLQLLNVTRTTSRSIERRDGLGPLAGFAALLSAGIAPVLSAVVGMGSLVRRGWKVAAFHTAPLGAFFVVWFRATADQRPD